MTSHVNIAMQIYYQHGCTERIMLITAMIDRRQINHRITEQPRICSMKIFVSNTSLLLNDSRNEQKLWKKQKVCQLN